MQNIIHVPLKLVIVGHVDHGKSTLVGRLLYDTHSLPDGKFEAIEASCKKRGMPFEWSFLMDALQAERDQNVTIDTTQIWLRLPKRDVVIIDAPGHKEFLRNMVTGAAQADAALLLIDAQEGIREQSKRHGMLLHLLGIRQMAVLVNKMDKVQYDQKIFDAIVKDYTTYLSTLDITPLCFIPVSARAGDNIASASTNMPWHKGNTVLTVLEKFSPASTDEQLPLRFPVQDVYKFDERRIVVGRIESGCLNIGDTLQFSPAGSVARVASIESWPAAEAKTASAGQSVGIILDTPIFVERGQIASHSEHTPMLTNRFRARIFWLGKTPLILGKRYKLKLQTAETTAELSRIEHTVDAETLVEMKTDKVEHGNVAEVVWRTRTLVAVDDYNNNPRLGRFVIQDGYTISGGGIISMRGFTDQRAAKNRKVKSENIFETDFGITQEERAIANGHLGGILWFTGLSGSGKSTIAGQAQKRLFDKGYQVFVLDGDNIRRGLASDLGFSPVDRSENIRRVAEVATLFAQSGMLVITSFISPYHADRERARATAPEKFHLVHVDCSLGACEKRDVKGLYKKAREGKIPEFTGVSAPYEAPENPDLVLDTEHSALNECVEQLLRYVDHHLCVQDKQWNNGGAV